MTKQPTPALTLALVIAVATAFAGTAAADSLRPPIKQNGTTCFNGYGYALDSGQYRYTEHHEQTRKNGRLTTWTVTYVGREGQVIARKTLDFTDHPTVPVYTMVVPRSGYMEGIRHQDGKWTMVRRDKRGANLQREPFQIQSPIAGDAGFNQLVKRHFGALASGRTLNFRFAVAGRLKMIDLNASKIGQTTFAGHKAVVFEAELDMFLINLFVDSLQLTYNPDTKRLLEYRGIGNIHNKNGETFKVRVAYYPAMPEVARQHGAPAADCSVDLGGDMPATGPRAD